MPEDYQMIDFPPLNTQQLKELKELENMSDQDLDYSDIPEQPNNGQFYYTG
ncbi:MAG: hypothetical protein IJT16_12945 [Lachnospiraceae bacterium]|nr:hypothetical protein [Lachnospiraceae bacterium]